LIRARSLLPEITLGLITVPGLASLTLRSRLVRLGPLFALHPNYQDVTPALVNAAHRIKSRVHAFTVNHPEDMRKLFNDGVDGIFTADPLMAQKVFAEIN
jgi:glycerophosphoryl diester phosphodiesterase